VNSLLRAAKRALGSGRCCFDVGMACGGRCKVDRIKTTSMLGFLHGKSDSKIKRHEGEKLANAMAPGRKLREGW
jgi:hypothetical protein